MVETTVVQESILTINPIVKDIVVPIITAIVGALVGALITFILQNKKDERQKIDSSKPIILNYDVSDGYAPRTFEEYEMYSCSKNDIEANATYCGYFTNTDKALFTIEKVVSEHKTYAPYGNKIVNKDAKFMIKINLVSGESLRDMKLYIRDINNISYSFIMIQKGNRFIIDEKSLEEQK